MTVPELRATLAKLSPPTAEDVKLRDLFLARLDAWPGDSSTVQRLNDDMDRLLGNVWFSTSSIHQQVFDALEAFAGEVRRISGMPMNERLVTFGLLEIWDASSEATRALIRSKLGAA